MGRLKPETRDKADYEEEFGKYYRDIQRKLLYLTGSVQAAEDLTQDTFIKLIEKPPHEQNNIKAWLIKVATNLAFNFLRGEKVKRAKDPVISDCEMANVISIEDLAIKNVEVRLVKKVLNSLPVRDRMCLLLKFSGYRYAEISKLTGIEVTSVGTVIARAQAKFKESYTKEARLK